jgi:flagellar hook-associated protein 3
MRMTNNLLTNNMLWNMNNNLNAMNKYHTDLASGTKIHRPSDDPVGITKLIKLKTDIAENEQYQQNNSDAKSWLEVTENSLMDIKDMFQRIRELAVQGSNGTYNETDTANIAKEVEQLKEELITTANSSIAGKYIFSGFKTDQVLLNEDGTFNFDITSSNAEDLPVISYEVTIGEYMEVGTNFIDVFGYVDVDNLVSNTFPVGENTGDAATHSSITGVFDLSEDYTVGDQIAIEYPVGTTYTVDMSDMDGSRKALSKADVVDRFLNASDGAGGTLSDVAEVYFNNGDELVIEAKAFGAEAMNVVSPSHTGFSIPADGIYLGESSTDATVSGTEIITDDDVLNESGMQEFVIVAGDHYEKIEINFSGLSSVAELETAIQDKLDEVFPDENITADLSSGALSFSLESSDDGSVASLSVDVIKSEKPQIIEDLENYVDGLNEKDDDKIQTFLGQIDDHIDNVLAALGEIGAKSNRIDFIQSRIEDNDISYTSLLSSIQDVDYAEAIIKFKSLESIYRASLSVGAQVIQPTLVDFIN